MCSASSESPRRLSKGHRLPDEEAGDDPMSWVDQDGSILQLQRRIGYRFNNPALLETALSHRSFCAEAGRVPSNERLEFLGDAVVGVIVTDYIYNMYPELNEGDLAKLRATVVSTRSLAQVAKECSLGSAVKLGKGEDASGGREKESILADTFEAVIGALYLDGGLQSASRFVLGMLEDTIVESAQSPGGSDFKTRLQEMVVQMGYDAPVYNVVGSGPDHDRRYRAEVYINDQQVGVGIGRSKKEAEQEAARVAWHTMRDSSSIEHWDVKSEGGENREDVSE